MKANSNLAFSDKLTELINHWTQHGQPWPLLETSRVLYTFLGVREGRTLLRRAYWDLLAVSWQEVQTAALRDLFALLSLCPDRTTLRLLQPLEKERRLFIQVAPCARGRLLTYQAGLQAGDRVVYSQDFALPDIFEALPAYLKGLDAARTAVDYLVQRTILLTLEITDHVRTTRQKHLAALL